MGKLKRFGKRMIALFTMLVMSVGMMSGCGKSDEEESYAEKKVLRVGMECAYAPFNWTQETEDVGNGDKALPIYDSSNYAYGYDVMVAMKIAEQLGWEVEIHKVEWDSIGLGLDSGEYDCIIGGMSYNEKRDESYDFTTPYYYRELCLTVKKGSDYENVTGLSQLAGKNITVTTQNGAAYVDYIDQIPDAVPTTFYSTTSECFLALSNNVADACIMDVPTAESALLTNTDLKILDLAEDDCIESGESANVCIAVREGDSELQDLIQGAMDDMGWTDNKTEMDALMSEAIQYQPASE